MIVSVLNFDTGELHIREVPRELEELEGDEIIEKMGYNSNNVQYMVNDGVLTVRLSTESLSGDLQF